MANQNLHPKDLVIGAVAGGVIGAVAALLMAPKTGDRLRQDICDMYDDVTDKTTHFADSVSKKGRAAVKSVSDQTCDWADKAKCLADDIRCWVHGEEEDTQMRDLVIGGIAGIVIGATAGLLLAPKAGSDFRQDIVDTYEDVNDKAHEMAGMVARRGKSFAKDANDRAHEWLEFAKDVVDQIAGEAQDKGEDIFAKGKKLLPKGKFNDLLDWAALGFRLWQGSQQKKRR